jgi:hypothetical protein
MRKSSNRLSVSAIEDKPNIQQQEESKVKDREEREKDTDRDTHTAERPTDR